MGWLGSVGLLAKESWDMENEVGLWVVEGTSPCWGRAKGKKECVGNADEIRAGVTQSVVKRQ